DGRGDLRHRRGERSRGDQRADVLHGDELLEELLVELRGEPDQHGARLVLGGVVVDHQGHLVGGLAVAALGRDEGPLHHRRDEDLVADARRLDHHAVLELAPEAAADRGDHRGLRARDDPVGRRPVTRAMPVMASPRASATWEGWGSAPRRSSVWTARCTWALPAAPFPVTARFTSEGVRASTGTPSWRAAR